MVTMYLGSAVNGPPSVADWAGGAGMATATTAISKTTAAAASDAIGILCLRLRRPGPVSGRSCMRGMRATRPMVAAARAKAAYILLSIVVSSLGVTTPPSAHGPARQGPEALRAPQGADLHCRWRTVASRHDLLRACLRTG
jgi:hypothetical protein